MAYKVGSAARRTRAPGETLALGLVLLLGALVLAKPATADIVQGVVAPANARVLVKNASGEQVSELGGGPFQLRLPAGRFTAECTSPTPKAIPFFSLAQPTTMNIDCS
jgi:hypothetical protein